MRISEALSYGKPVLVADLKCVGSEAYLKLVTEVIQREREPRMLIYATSFLTIHQRIDLNPGGERIIEIRARAIYARPGMTVNDKTN